MFVADRRTFAHPERPLMLVDGADEPGLPARMLPKRVGIIDANLGECNQGFDEAGSGDFPDGIIRR